MITIVIPVWHHPALVDEAIQSCLAQENAPPFDIVIVNDGCDLAQTRQSLDGWQSAHPEKITLLTQPNQGLSAARNTGIAHALKNPEMRAIYFLDADNRLDANALALFDELLKKDKEPGWFSPQFDRFGIENNISNGNIWSLSRLAADNFCDAGSLVRRAVFETGLRFDPDFNVGFEDWDFWLGAAKNGFVGAPVRQNFLRYRKRPESMITSAQRQYAQLTSQLREKHKWLFNTARLPEAWNQEWPRFALIATDGACAIGSNPMAAEAIDREMLISEVFNHRANPSESRLPPVLVFYSPEAVAQLRAAKMLDSCYYQLEGGLRQSPIVVVNLKEGAPDIRVGEKVPDLDGLMLNDGDIIAMSLHHLEASLDRDEMALIVQYMLENVSVLPMSVYLQAPKAAETPPLAALMDFVGELILSPMAEIPARQYRNWREPAFSPIAWTVAQNNAGGRPALAPLGAGPQVGFVIQVFSFGGVEKCLVALAEALSKQGITCHLFIYGEGKTDAAAWMFDPFEKIWLLKDPALRDWGGSRYLGSSESIHPGDAHMGDMLGPLTQMDVIVNCGAGVLNHGLAALRGRGIKTVAWEHIIDSSPYGRPSGTPLISVGYEAGFDHVITCSQQLATQMAALGVPRHKLLPLPNGPGYASEAKPVRPTRHGRLRVGFLGRFDPQKQVERFVDVAASMREALDFTVCGGSVLGASVSLPAWLPVSPPVKSRAALDAFYASIDVLLMPSRDEGLPLTILEAQRAGVVVLASDVGAVSEAIIDGETGFLLPPDAVVQTAVSTLNRLDQSRNLLTEIARNAAGKPDRWQQNAADFINSLL